MTPEWVKPTSSYSIEGKFNFVFKKIFDDLFKPVALLVSSPQAKILFFEVNNKLCVPLLQTFLIFSFFSNNLLEKIYTGSLMLF